MSIFQSTFRRLYSSSIKLVIATGFLCFTIALSAYETDQYSTSFYLLKDSTEVMDKIVNDAIRHVVYNWDKDKLIEESTTSPIFKSNVRKNDYKLLTRIAGFFHSRQLEYRISNSKQIESRNVKADSVFKTTGWESSPIIRWKGLAPSFSLNNVQIGADKLSHFFGVGWIYWKKSEIEYSGKPEKEKMQAVIKEGTFTEENYWGRLSTNIFSNADLVANWEGYLFYRGILENHVINGKKAIIRWEGETPIIQREFTYRDHVNDFWSESLLPNDYDSMLAVKVKNVLKTYCSRPEFIKNPARWVSPNFDTLWKKYRHLGLVENSINFRLDKVCDEFNQLAPEARKAFLIRQKQDELDYLAKFEAQDAKLLNQAPITNKLIPRISSPVPTCNGDIQSAINEHIIISQHASQYSPVIQEYLDKATNKVALSKYDLFSFDDSRKLSKVFLRSFFSGIKKIKMKTQRWDNLHRTRASEVITHNDNSLNITAEFTNYRGGLIKACAILPISFKETVLSVRADTMNVSLYHCRYTHKETGKVEKSMFWRGYDNTGMLRSSLESYYPLSDREAYVYRTIPKICKWY